jgi:hypothetical protein
MNSNRIRTHMPILTIDTSFLTRGGKDAFVCQHKHRASRKKKSAYMQAAEDFAILTGVG